MSFSCRNIHRNEVCLLLYNKALSVFKRNLSAITKNSCLVKNSSSKENKLGFVGTGKIAQAIILGLLMKNKILPEQIYATDANLEYLNFLREKSPIFQKYKINFLNDNKYLFKEANTVILCVKPKDIHELLKKTTHEINKSHLILSIAAGIQLKQIEKHLSNEVRVIRIMTNTAALIQKSCSVFTKGTKATKEDCDYVKSLLESIGTCEGEVDEDLIDVITGLSGSGPAYMFYILDALADGGVKMGLSRQLALKLASQTMLGSSSMVIEEINKQSNGKHIMQLKEEVCSPGGTTIYGISELEKNKVRSALIKCVEEATLRAKQLNSQK